MTTAKERKKESESIVCTFDERGKINYCMSMAKEREMKAADRKQWQTSI